MLYNRFIINIFISWCKRHKTSICSWSSQTNFSFQRTFFFVFFFGTNRCPHRWLTNLFFLLFCFSAFLLFCFFFCFFVSVFFFFSFLVVIFDTKNVTLQQRILQYRKYFILKNLEFVSYGSIWIVLMCVLLIWYDMIWYDVI